MSLLKKLRKWLRQKKGLLAIGLILLSITIAASMSKLMTESPSITIDDEIMDVMATTKPVSLILETHYLCGTETEHLQFHSNEDLQHWLDQQRQSWQIADKTGNTIILVREVDDDLAPLCKNEGYFGLSADGILTLYQGPPVENQVIQTFFRIDTQLLESKLPQSEILSLKSGIRISDVNEYLSVLSTYGEFATEY